VGFAARKVLANFVAGIMLAVTQPIRVGDWVTIEGNYGEVVDVRLNYTVLKSGDARIIVPNERLAGDILKNDTLVADVATPDVSVWLAPDADVERALAVLAEETGKESTVAEVLPWGVRLAVSADSVAPSERTAREAELRRRCFARLRAEGLLKRP
jgi:small-conductance mechanosensitive channel